MRARTMMSSEPAARTQCGAMASSSLTLLDQEWNFGLLHSTAGSGQIMGTDLEVQLSALAEP